MLAAIRQTMMTAAEKKDLIAEILDLESVDECFEHVA